MNADNDTDSNSLTDIGYEEVQSSVEKIDSESDVSEVFQIPQTRIACHLQLSEDVIVYLHWRE